MGTKTVIEACKEAGVQVRMEELVEYLRCECELVISELWTSLSLVKRLFSSQCGDFIHSSQIVKHNACEDPLLILGRDGILPRYLACCPCTNTDLAMFRIKCYIGLPAHRYLLLLFCLPLPQS